MTVARPRLEAPRWCPRGGTALPLTSTGTRVASSTSNAPPLDLTSPQPLRIGFGAHRPLPGQSQRPPPLRPGTVGRRDRRPDGARRQGLTAVGERVRDVRAGREFPRRAVEVDATAGRRGRDEPGQVIRASWGNQGEASVSELNRRELMLLSVAGALQPGAMAAGQAAVRDGLQRERAGFSVPPDYLREPEHVPDFWVSMYEEVRRFLDGRVRRGRFRRWPQCRGRPIRATFYGRPRSGRGRRPSPACTRLRRVFAWFGPDYARKVYLAVASVHGGEFEGIVGVVNLIAVLETGTDLRGQAWPEIMAAAAALDRIVLIPILNADGRYRVPFRMGAPRG